MTYFVIFALDRPGTVDTRAATREAHRAYIRAPGVDARLVAGGPLTDDAGAMIGTLLVVDAPDRATARAFADGDPYAAADLFARRDVVAWNWTTGAPAPAAD